MSQSHCRTTFSKFFSKAVIFHSTLFSIGNISGINVPPAPGSRIDSAIAIARRAIEKRHTPFDFAVVRPPLTFRALPALGRMEVTETFSWPWSVEARGPGTS